MVAKKILVHIIAIVYLLFFNVALAQERPKILVLHSYHHAYKWTHDINKGIRHIFSDLTKVDLFVEYMDTKKYVDDNYYKILVNIYEKKYKDITFDVIISSDDNAFNFLKKHHKELFKGVPIIFCGTNYIKKSAIQGFPNFTGVSEEAEIQKNFELIFKLHPDVKNIYAITDTSKTGSIVRSELEEVIKMYSNKNIDFHIIDNTTYSQLMYKVKRLPENSVILFTIFIRSSDNQFFEYYKISEDINNKTNVPIYGLWDFSLGHGIIGGFLTSGYFQGETAGKIAKKILEGMDVGTIPIIEQSPNQYMFDYKQLKKHNIDEALLPYDAVYINKEISILDLYFKELLSILVLFILMAFFILILLININKRKIAEKRISKQLSFQQDLIDNVNTPIYYKNNKRVYIGCNKAFLELFQLPKEAVLNKTAFDLTDKKTAKFFQAKDTEILKTHKLQEYESSVTFNDGETKDLIFYKNVFYEEGIVGGIVGVIFDVTEKNSLNYDLNRLLTSFDSNVIASKTNKEGRLLYVSEAFIEISGYEKNELLGRRHNVLKSGLHDNAMYEELWETLKENKIWMGEITNKKRSGEYYTLQTIITPEYNKNGEFLNYTAISQDITPQKLIMQAHKEIELLNEDIVSTQKEIIFKLGAIAEARSKETGMHVKRVAEYSKLLAQYYGLSPHEIEIVRTASPMHDIGKIAIPDAILNKPGKFTSEEFEIMKTHSKIGYDMLKDSNKTILKAAAIIAHEHQEKYDGSGYPRGLKAEEIHIYGRITAVADVFDALGSDRIYKIAWEDEKIFSFFKEQAGKHFDPVLISLFFKNLDKFLEIRDQFKDV